MRMNFMNFLELFWVVLDRWMDGIGWMGGICTVRGCNGEGWCVYIQGGRYQGEAGIVEGVGASWEYAIGLRAYYLYR